MVDSIVPESDEEENYENDDFAGLNDEDTMKILVTSDINLGYEETLQRKQNDDSFVTFEEILQEAVKNQVDLILIAGNLFHRSNPTQVSMLKCIDLLRKYCMGLRDIQVQLLTDPNLSHHSSDCTVNFEDPNFNVQIPVFCIHGNKDESLRGDAGPLDILTTIGLLNYFGTPVDLEQIEVKPLILKKGDTKLALYGLGHVHEQKMIQMFEEGKIHFKDISRNRSLGQTFNLLMIHEQRQSELNPIGIEAGIFPNFFNLLIWGHEHESKVDLKKVPGKNYCITQPGSTVATTLTSSEAVEKCIGILHINKKQMKMEKIKLRTVRPFIYKEIVLRKQNIRVRHPRSEQVFNFIGEYIEDEILPSVEEYLSGHSLQPKVPIIRLRILYDSDKDICDTIGLCRQFCDRIANSMEMLAWKKFRYGQSTAFEQEEDDAWTGTEDEEKWYTTVQDRLTAYFDNPENKSKLSVLSVKGLNYALGQCVEKGDNKSFESVVKFEVSKGVKYSQTLDVTNEEEIEQKINDFCVSRQEHEEEHVQEIIDMLHGSKHTSEISIGNLEMVVDEPSTSKTRGKKPTGPAQTAALNKSGLDITVSSAKKRGAAKTTSRTAKTFVKPANTSVASYVDFFETQDSDD